MKTAHPPRSFAYSLLFGALTATSFGLGFRIPDQGASATARGDAFAATADDPSAIYYNPAGITQLEGTRALLGGYAITLQTRISLANDNGNFSNSNTHLQAVPTFFATWKPENCKLALGVGTYVPFGFAVTYPDDTPFRTIARKGSIQVTTVNPVAAYQLTDTLSIALGAEISYGRAELDRGVVIPGDNFRFKGDGDGYGIDAGIMWNPHKMHHFGLTYHGPQRIDFSGHSSVDIDSFYAATPFGPVKVPPTHTRERSDAEFDLPQTITAGYSFRPTDDWNFEFDVDWADWGSLNTVTLHQNSGDVPIPFNWRSSFMYEFGVTKKFSHNFHVSAGYVYSQTSVPNESFNPAIPDSTRHIFSAGFGQGYEHFNWTVAYQYTYGPARTISQGTAADGVYRFDSHAITLSLGYNF